MVGFLGVDIMASWLIHSKTFATEHEYLIIWASFFLTIYFVSISSFGVLLGMTISTFLSCMVFVLHYASKSFKNMKKVVYHKPRHLSEAERLVFGLANSGTGIRKSTQEKLDEKLSRRTEEALAQARALLDDGTGALTRVKHEHEAALGIGSAAYTINATTNGAGGKGKEAAADELGEEQLSWEHQRAIKM